MGNRRTLRELEDRVTTIEGQLTGVLKRLQVLETLERQRLAVAKLANTPMGAAIRAQGQIAAAAAAPTAQVADPAPGGYPPGTIGP